MSPELITGAALFAAGLSLRAWGSYHLMKYGGHKPPQMWLVGLPVKVVTSGPYRFVRHPLYYGTMLWLAGLGIMALGWGGIVLPVGIWSFYTERMIQEEALCAARLELEAEGAREGV